MTPVAGELDLLRLAVGEIDAIVAVTVNWFRRRGLVWR